MWKYFLNGDVAINVQSVDEYLDLVKRAKKAGLNTDNYNEKRYWIYGKDTCISVYNGYLGYSSVAFAKNRNCKIVEYKNMDNMDCTQCNHEIVDMKELIRMYLDGNATIDDFVYITVVDLDNHYVDKAVNLDLDVLLEMLSDNNVVFIK